MTDMDDSLPEEKALAEVPPEETVCEDTAKTHRIFSAMGADMSWQTPWDYLCQTAHTIVSRDCPGNEQEQSLLPLLREISALAYPTEHAPCFPSLKELLRRYGCKKGVRLLERMEKCAPGSKMYTALAKKLLGTLNKVRWEKLWWEVYEKLEASQAEYPSEAEVVCPPALLQHVRGEIWQRMEQYGYDGNYPAFRRKKLLSGIHLADSYGACYSAGMKRNTRFRIHCFETVRDGELVIRFVTGTALTRKGEKIKGIFSCLFNARGRRFHNGVEYTVPLSDRQPDSDLSQYIKAAVKKAALRPLSRKEKKAIGQKPKAGFGTFMKTLLLSGGVFALILVGILVLGSCTAMYLVDGLEAAKKLLLQFPWLLFLAGAWLVYGLPVAAMTVAAKNK